MYKKNKCVRITLFILFLFSMGNALAIMPSFQERNVFSEIFPPESLLVDQKGFILLAGKEFDQQEIENFLKIFAKKGCKMVEGDYQKFFHILYEKTSLQEDFIISSQIDFYKDLRVENQKFHLKIHPYGFEFGLKENTRGVTLDDVIYFFWRNGVVGYFDLEKLQAMIDNPGLKTRSLFVSQDLGEKKDDFYDPIHFVEQIKSRALLVVNTPKKSLPDELREKIKQRQLEISLPSLEQLEEEKFLLNQKLKKHISSFSQNRSTIEAFIASYIEINFDDENLKIPLTNKKSIEEAGIQVEEKLTFYKGVLKNRDVINRDTFEGYITILEDLQKYVVVCKKIVDNISESA